MRPSPASALGALLLAFVLGCSSLAPAPAPTATPVAGKPAAKPVGKPGSAPTTEAAPAPTAVTRAFPVEAKTYIEGVLLPSSLTFAPDGRLFFVEVTQGTVRVAQNGLLRPEPFCTLEIARAEEHGILGLTLDPAFSQNGHVYVFYTTPKKSGKPDENRIVRLTDRGGTCAESVTLSERLNLPLDVKGSHNGGRMKFGPDGKLYVTTGSPGDDATEAQSLEILEGKLLRLNPDGSIPADNPFPGSPIYALGFRNSWGLDFNPQNGKPYVTDNGPRGYDEFNLVERGANYGSPDVTGAPGDPRFVDPLWHSGATRLGVTGLTFYTGAQFPEYQGDAFYCLWNTGTLMRVRLAPPAYDRVLETEDFASSCRTDVISGPDGALYVADFSRILRLSR